MGLNTAALILNDGLTAIKEDPSIGDRIDGGIAAAHRSGGGITAYGDHVTHIDAIKVLPSQHADYVQIVAVGGNCIRRLGSSGRWEPEDLLRDLAEQMGYSLRKRPTRA